MKEQFIDKVRLGIGHGIIMGHRPDNLSLDKISKTLVLEKDIEQLGFFETGSPNYNTYYPDVKLEDLKPKDDDFIKPIFRALSEVTVHKQFNPIDFSEGSVLRKSMSKLIGQSIYPNHEPIVGQELGSISAVSWQESYKTDKGIIVPAGINAELKIDGKSHPNIARGILMEPPSIHSCSVTIQFKFEKSHPDMDNQDFWNKLGTYDKDGKLIRRIVTDIVSYHEISLVSHGADVFAQKVKENGQITNPEYANTMYSLSAQGIQKPMYYNIDYKNMNIDIISNSGTPTPPSILKDSNNINNENPMKELIAKLAKRYNVPEDQITEKFIEDKLTEVETKLTGMVDKTLLTTQEGLVAAKTTEITNLTAEKERLQVIVDAQLTSLREETKRVYGILKGDKSDAAKLAIYDKANLEEIRVHLKEVETELEANFPATCKDCNSSNVSRNIAKVGEQEDLNNKNKNKGTKSFQELNAELVDETKKQNWMGDKEETK